MSLDLAIKIVATPGDQAAGEIRKVRAETEQFGATSKRAANDAAAGFAHAEASTRRLSGETRTLSGAYSGLAAAVGAVLSVQTARYLLAEADAYGILQQRIRTATNATGDYAEVSRRAYAISQDNGAALESTVVLFQRVSRAASELQASNDQILAFTDTIQKLGVIGGSSQAEMANGTMQLSQAMAGGIVRAEEWNSIVENMPEVAARLGDALGKTAGQMRETVNAGELLSKDVFAAILSVAPQVAAEFEAMAGTIDRSGQRAGNAWSSLLGRFAETTGVTQAVASGLDDVAESMDAIDADDIEAALDALATTARAAGAGMAGLLVARSLPPVMAVASQGVWNLVAAVRVYETTAARAAVVGRGLLTALGGWPGVIAGAVTAVGAWMLVSRDAGDSTREWREEIELLTQSTDELTRRRLADAVAAMDERINAQEQRVVQLHQRLRTDQYATPGTAIHQKYTAELLAEQKILDDMRAGRDTLNAKLAETAEQTARLADAHGQAADATEKQIDAERKLLDQLLPLRKAYRDYYTDMAGLNAAYARGAIGADEYAEALFNLNAGLERSIEKADSAGDSHSRLAGSIKSSVVGISEESKAVAAATQNALSAGEQAWVDFVTTGEASMEDLANAVAREIARMQYAAFAAQASSGLLNSFFGGLQNGFNFSTASTYNTNVGSEQTAMLAQQDAGLYHTGGVVGTSSTQRTLPAAVWAGAPRYHSGGVAGLSPDEVPAILLRGERVLSREESAAYGAGGNVTVHQTFDFRGADANAETRLRAAAADIERRTRASIITEMNRRGPAARASGRSR